MGGNASLAQRLGGPPHGALRCALHNTHVAAFKLGAPIPSGSVHRFFLIPFERAFSLSPGSCVPRESCRHNLWQGQARASPGQGSTAAPLRLTAIFLTRGVAAAGHGWLGPWSSGPQPRRRLCERGAPSLPASRNGNCVLESAHLDCLSRGTAPAAAATAAAAAATAAHRSLPTAPAAGGGVEPAGPRVQPRGCTVRLQMAYRAGKLLRQGRVRLGSPCRDWRRWCQLELLPPDCPAGQHSPACLLPLPHPRP